MGGGLSFGNRGSVRYQRKGNTSIPSNSKFRAGHLKKDAGEISGEREKKPCGKNVGGRQENIIHRLSHYSLEELGEKNPKRLGRPGSHKKRKCDNGQALLSNGAHECL